MKKNNDDMYWTFVEKLEKKIKTLELEKDILELKKEILELEKELLKEKNSSIGKETNNSRSYSVPA